MILKNGAYTIQGVTAKSICEQFGTPVFVYDGEKIKTQIQKLRQAFASQKTRIKYAAKALTNISILKLMKAEGVEIDAVSIEEVKLALHAGFLPSQIQFTPNGVDFSEIDEAVQLKVAVNIDNLPALEKFGKKYGHSYPCCIRLNPHVMAGGNLKISTGHSQSKFGISIYRLPQILDVVNQYNIYVSGLHIHTGSELKDVDTFLKVAEVLFTSGKEFPELNFIDFGGGFKVSYQEGDAETDMEALGKKLGEAFDQFCKVYGRPLELWIEPGKYLVSEAGYLLTKVNVVKETPTVTFIGVNTGLNHLVRPMMYDAYHEIVNVSNPSGELYKYNVVGYICETDTLGSERMIAEANEGDIIAIKNAGAYGYSMSSNYNSRLRPAEVLVMDGQARLIREAEKFEDLLRGQL
jgi:diaminopimelate decarboxylase